MNSGSATVRPSGDAQERVSGNMSNEFDFITFLRALAAAWVLAAHCMIWGDWRGIPIPNAKIAVDLFMVISGFLMFANASLRANTEPLDTARGTIRFWTRRFFRLAPAYYASLLAVVLLNTWYLDGYLSLQGLNPDKWPRGGVYDPRSSDYSARNLLWHVTFLFGLHPNRSFSTFLPDWSLSLEMQFYAVFPFLWLFVRRFNSPLALTAFGLATFAAGVLFSERVHFAEPSLLILKLHYFIVGILLAQTALRVKCGKRPWGTAVCAMALTSCDFFRYGSEFLTLPVIILLLITLIVIARDRHPSPLRTALIMYSKKVFANRIILFGSDVSYSVYLFHGFFISMFGLLLANYEVLRQIQPPWRFGLMLAFVGVGAYAFSYCTYRAIELPGVALGKFTLTKLRAS